VAGAYVLAGVWLSALYAVWFRVRHEAQNYPGIAQLLLVWPYVVVEVGVEIIRIQLAARRGP